MSRSRMVLLASSPRVQLRSRTLWPDAASTSPRALPQAFPRHVPHFQTGATSRASGQQHARAPPPSQRPSLQRYGLGSSMSHYVHTLTVLHKVGACLQLWQNTALQVFGSSPVSSSSDPLSAVHVHAGAHVPVC